jgi:hypothetical protein
MSSFEDWKIVKRSTEAFAPRAFPFSFVAGDGGDGCKCENGAVLGAVWTLGVIELHHR